MKGRWFASVLFAIAIIGCVLSGCSGGSTAVPQGTLLPPGIERSNAASTAMFYLTGGLPKSGPAQKVRSLTILSYGSNGKPQSWNLNKTLCRATHACGKRVRYRGNPTFLVRSYEKKNGAGKLLSTTVVTGQNIGLTLVPSVAQATVEVTDPNPLFGKTARILLVGVGIDASGDFIIGPAPYDRAVKLRVQGNMQITSTTVSSAVRPVSLTYDGGYEYARVSLISKFQFHGQFPTSATLRPQLASAIEQTTTLQPSPQLATASDGSVWLGDFGNCLLAKINSDLTTTPYPMPTSIDCPGYLATGPDGNVWFSTTDAPHVGRSTGTSGIGYVTPSGAITAFPNGDDMGAIAAGPDGKFWSVGGLSGDVYSVTTTGVASKAAYSLAMPNVHAIVAGPDGNLWIPYYRGSDHGFDLISTAGTLVKSYKAKVSPPVIVRGAYVYAVLGLEPQQVVGEWDSVGRLHARYSSPDGLFSVSQFAIRSDGSIWYATGQNTPSTYVLARITASGRYCELSVPVRAAPYGLGEISGLVFGGDGDLYYSETQPSYIGKIRVPVGK